MDEMNEEELYDGEDDIDQQQMNVGLSHQVNPSNRLVQIDDNEAQGP